MNGTFKLLSIVAVAFSLVVMSISDADARRFGGGKSFGGKSTFKRSASAPRSASQQQAFNKNQGARQQMASRGGLMGMLGGLAIGGLLGALLFGGAFENLNFFDILIFGGIAFLLFKLLSSRRKPPAQAAGAYGAAGGGSASFGREPESQHTSSRPQGGHAFDTDVMFRKGNTTGHTAGNLGGGGSALATSAGGGDADFGSEAEPAGIPPAGFNEREFLSGAERAYHMLQKGWNDGDLSEIRGLTTDEMFALVQDQYREADADLYVEVLKAKAELLDVRETGDVQEATVLFDAILREGSDQRPEQAREVWHFTRSAASKEPKWYLDGIQQLED